jgi:hypothetical protein
LQIRINWEAIALKVKISVPSRSRYTWPSLYPDPPEHSRKRSSAEHNFWHGLHLANPNLIDAVQIARFKFHDGRRDLGVIAHTIAIRISRSLEKAGYLVRDAESEYLELMQDEEDAMDAIVGPSITYRLAFGPNAGRKALTLQTVPVKTEQRRGDDLVAKQAGFSLHAGIACKSNQRKKLERLCRYITRPAIAERRLSLANNGNVVIALKTPYDDGTTHVVLSPMEFMGRLVPSPRSNRSYIISQGETLLASARPATLSLRDCS